MYYDRTFLKQLDEHRTKIIYARIIALTLEEAPIETIEGRVTEGSINIDGDSSVRRTCSLTMVAQDFNYNEFIWGLNTKFKLEIGLENTINSAYPSIIWFKQGTYFISQFNTSHSVNNFTISLQGKDKMCMLNGELGGALTSSVDFGTIEDIITLEDGKQTTKITKLPLKEIIRDMVHLYGGEPLHNIIINDLDMAGLELLEYRYDEKHPLYLYRDAKPQSAFRNVTLDGDKPCFINAGNSEEKETTLNELTSNELELLISPMIGTKTPVAVRFKEEILNPSTGEKEDYDAYIAKIEYGTTAGYRYTELTYAGDLIGAIGESITSILDKIKNMLGDFEYFYDLDGQFIFQRKRYSFESTWSPISLNENGQEVVDFDNNIAYTFSDSTLVTTFNNNPDLTKLKNDYSVWGARKSLSGKDISVHMRYAIDRKPISYTTIDNVIYTAQDWDWRELIYQMAVDYNKNSNKDDFTSKLAAANMQYYPTGKTGYENYYTDMLKYWRDLYNPNPGEINIENYYTSSDKYPYWNKNVYLAPQNLDFWFDFLDTEGELSKYSVKNVGCRPKAINDSNVKAIYFREVPNVLFTTNYEEDSSKNQGYTYISINPALMNTMFSISAQGKSAKGAIDELLYQHSYCVTAATINTIPIYYLEPNNRIHIVDKDAGLEGYYNISKLSIPLKYDGIMSITATKAAETI